MTTQKVGRPAEEKSDTPFEEGEKAFWNNVADTSNPYKHSDEEQQELEGYAMEELVAELGSAFLSADLGLTYEVREDHAAYLASWLKVLKEDKRAIFSAAAHAQRAAEFLHSLQPSPCPHSNRQGAL